MTEHFKERCGERGLSSKKLKKAVKEGKTSIKVDKNKNIKIITLRQNEKIKLITAHEETKENKDIDKKHLRGSHKLAKQNKMKLRNKYETDENEELMNEYNIKF